ncbi:MAG: hypothetical protein M3Z35_17550, partial [Nitrospirota bacterium]|nr:hypothetical protein [Nitrospirota bacterium]
MQVRVWKWTKLFSLLALCCASVATYPQQIPNSEGENGQSFVPHVPQMWNDQAMSTLEVESPDPAGSPKHAPAEYYYKLPVRPIYKSYSVYAPGHEPPGYMEWLRQQQPEIVWDTT